MYPVIIPNEQKISNKDGSIESLNEMTNYITLQYLLTFPHNYRY